MAKMTIKEVAKLANVSMTAVSFVLNDKKGVSPATREKVMKIIEQFDYTPNPNSRRLIFNKTNNIVVLFKRNISPLEHYFHAEINNVILHECEIRGYNLIFASFKVNDDHSIEFPAVIKSYDADGIIFYGDIDPVILSGIQRYDIPFIVIDSHSPDSNVLSVSADYEKAAYTAVSHLIDKGRSDIAYIGNNTLAAFYMQTFNGYKRAMEGCGFSIRMEWLRFDAVDEISAYRSMEGILSAAPFPSAVFCCADIYAIGAVNCMKARDIRVPDDISVASIDDIILSRYTDPKITTVKIDKSEMGHIAIDLLMKKIEGESVENIVIKSDTLIVRES
ncbi:MAG: LacI family DNA-binding transcriptional regulator [Saccharofermentanales bacterium]